MDNEKVLLVVREMMVQLQNLERALAANSRESRFPVERLEWVKQRKCLICEKQIPEGERVVRGAHESCYRSLKRNVIDKLLKTDEEAIASGLLLPPDAGGRPEKGVELLEKFDGARIANEIRAAKKTKKKGTE